MIERAVAVRSSPISALRWGAVFAGLAVGIALNLVLAIAGTALGLALDAPDPGRAALPVAAAAWNVIAMLVSAFVGGYVAARASALRRAADGALHGAVAWGATTLAFAMLAVTSLGLLLGGLFGAVLDYAQPGAVGDVAGAERALDAAAAASAWLAGAIALSLIAGVAGGALGARGARRFVHRPLVAPVDEVTQPGLHDTRPAVHVR
jgi:hypothetical protein